MEHTYYFDGDQKKISWIIESFQSRSEESRIHAEYFYNIVTIEQSKYIALHVGIFWSIGRFIIKNGDTVKVMLDLKTMFDRLVKNKSTNDTFIEKRMKFIDQIIRQRDLDARYQIIDPAENKAAKLLLSNN
jgi:Fe-S cluster assembly scaffold protein SufB